LLHPSAQPIKRPVSEDGPLNASLAATSSRTLMETVAYCYGREKPNVASNIAKLPEFLER
jgi:hypothetical protein